MQTQTLRLHIGGMTCGHCQQTIEKALRAMPGVNAAKVELAAGTAEVTIDQAQTNQAALSATIEALGYTVRPRGKQQHAWLRPVGLLALIVAVYGGLQATGLLNLLVPGQLAQANMSYGMLFVIGLLTSVHCVAMCGGINVSQCLVAGEAGNRGTAAVGPALWYNLGRVISYTAVGFVVGALGSAITFSPAVQGWLKLAAGVFMLWMGAHLLGWFPSLGRFLPHLPRALSRRLSVRQHQSRNPLVVGLLNGLMPCGPLQAMQLYALGTGSAWGGALSMLLFSLGTVPLMFGLGALSTVLTRRFTRGMMTAGAVLVAALGLSMLSQGWVLAGVPAPATAEPTNPQAAQVQAADAQVTAAAQVQEVASTLAPSRYPAITVKAGTPVRWTITAPQGSINGCNNRMLIPEWNLEHTFTAGDNIIEFTPTREGTFRYTCWMGMIQSTITVLAADAELPTQTQAPALTKGIQWVATEEPQPVPNTIATENVAVAQLGKDEAGEPIQRVRVTWTQKGFQPAVIVLLAGVDAEWTVAVEGAEAQLMVPAFSAELTLQPGDNPLYLYPTQAFVFSAGDGAHFGYAKVVETLEDPDLTEIRQEAAAAETIRYPAGYFSTAGSCCQ